MRRAYTGYLHDPQVAVALKEFEHPYFVAGGEVGKPGKVRTARRHDDHGSSGDCGRIYAPEARHSQVLLFRRVNDELVEARVFNLKKMLQDKSLGEAALLRPGDLVFVPQNSISKIEPFHRANQP